MPKWAPRNYSSSHIWSKYTQGKRKTLSHHPVVESAPRTAAQRVEMNLESRRHRREISPAFNVAIPLSLVGGSLKANESKQIG